MEQAIKESEYVTKIIKKDIEFPFYGWWSHRKEEIIKIDLDYYENLNPRIVKCLKCIIVRNGFSMTPFITCKTISVNNGVIDGEILPLLRDYADSATEQEFKEFRKQTFDVLD